MVVRWHVNILDDDYSFLSGFALLLIFALRSWSIGAEVAAQLHFIFFLVNQPFSWAMLSGIQSVD